MITYRSNTVDIEAMQWLVGPDDHGDPAFSAKEIVAWVDANGGTAKYQPQSGVSGMGMVKLDRPRIAVLTTHGWAYALPGHYIVMGEAWFTADEDDPGKAHACREFDAVADLSDVKVSHTWTPVPAAG